MGARTQVWKALPVGWRFESFPAYHHSVLFPGSSAVERRAVNALVGGSIPSLGATFKELSMSRHVIQKRTNNRTVLKKLTIPGQLHCAFCEPNKGCNATGKRRPRSDKYKDHRKGLK